MAKELKGYTSYKEYLCSLNLQRARIASLLGSFLICFSSILDAYMQPEYFLQFLAFRVSCAVVVLLVYGLSFTKWGVKNGLSLGMLVVFFISATLSFIIHRLGYESPYYAGLNLVILAIGVLFTWEFHEALLASVGVYLMYLIPILVRGQIEDYKIFVNNNLFIIETIIIAAASCYFTSKLRKKEFEAQRNLTDAKDRLAQSYTELSELDQAKMNFFSNISHELRTPLTLILAPVESILKEGVANVKAEELQEKIEIINANGLRLLKLINNLLDVVRVDTGKMKLSYSKNDLMSLIKRVLSNLSALAERKKIQIQMNSDVPSIELYMDEENVEKVIVNLVYNSLKFTPEDGKIQIWCEDRSGEVEIHIQDNGIGIQKENLKKIFEPFVQVNIGDKRRYEGSGIGLALCREIVELHGGKIWAESAPGQGTTMRFTLPKKQVVKINSSLEDEKEDWTKTISKKAIYQGDESLFIRKDEKFIGEMKNKNGTVLIVEDNLDMRQFLCSELKRHFSIYSAVNGQEGLQVAEEHLPELVISDVMMPEMDGYEFCGKLKQGEKTKQIPVLLLTAKADLDMRLTGYHVGADDYVVKPFQVEELVAKAKALIQARKLERGMEMYRRLATIGELAAGVSHELGNSLTGALQSVEAIKNCVVEENKQGRDRELFDDLIRAQKNAQAGIERALRVVEDLYLFSQKNVEGFKRNDIHQGIDAALSLLEYKIKNKQIKVHKNYMKLESVFCHLGEMNQVFLNILDNAIDFNKSKGEIWVRTEKKNGAIVISIKDTGNGIAQENKPHIFDPFFTTKRVGEGKGLGLSISYGFVKQHHGKIEVVSEVGKGTEFKIILPERGRKNHE